MLLLLCVIPSVAIGQLVEWPLAEGGNGHYYEVIPAPSGITWDDANSQAAGMGRYLATVTSEAENLFVFSLLDEPQFWNSPTGGTSGPWLGGFQSPDLGGPADDWNWVTGEPWSYTNWAVNQPNDAYGWIEDKLHYWDPAGGRAPTWNDIQNIDPAGYQPIAFVTEVPEPSAFALIVIAGLSLLRRHR